MAKIDRNPVKASKEPYDLIIVGGGVYGAMLALEATRSNLRPLLLERDDFGEFTSFNSMRIIHGGFRYLQSLDLHRLRESAGELRWFLQNFPDLVKPLKCLMPLYGRGLRRPLILRAGLLAYKYLSRDPNILVNKHKVINAGRVVDAFTTQKLFSSVDTEKLRGGAIWHDGFVPDSQRLVMEILRWSCEGGATVLNYIEATQLLKSNNRVAGLMALDKESGQQHEFRANIVINASGPWCRDVATLFDRDDPRLFRSMMAWNILFNREALSDYALAVTPKKLKGHTYFLIPWKEMLLVGTGQAPWLSKEKKPMPSQEQIATFCEDINLAVPSLRIRQDEIIRIFPGIQPATRLGGKEFAKREFILNHSKNDGPKGLYSISGVKFTTSHLVAEITLNLIFPERSTRISKSVTFRPTPRDRGVRGSFTFHWYSACNDSDWKEALRMIIVEESVMHLDDLIFRRTSLGDNPARAIEIAPLVCDLFDWDQSRRHEEISRLKNKMGEFLGYSQKL